MKDLFSCSLQSKNKTDHLIVLSRRFVPASPQVLTSQFPQAPQLLYTQFLGEVPLQLFFSMSPPRHPDPPQDGNTLYMCIKERQTFLVTNS